MRTRLKSLAAISALIATAPQSAEAHHTFTVKYDGSKTAHISGMIGSVSYANPHVMFSVGGWMVETESPAALTAKGLSKGVLKDGAKATVSGWPARNGSSQMGASSISIVGGPSVTTRGSAR